MTIQTTTMVKNDNEPLVAPEVVFHHPKQEAKWTCIFILIGIFFFVIISILLVIILIDIKNKNETSDGLSSTYNSCYGVANNGASLNGLTISPDPIIVPGTATVTFDLAIKKNFNYGGYVFIDIQHRVWGILWMSVLQYSFPACPFLKEICVTSNTTLSGMDSAVPCSCPIPVGTYPSRGSFFCFNTENLQERSLLDEDLRSWRTQARQRRLHTLRVPWDMVLHEIQIESTFLQSLRETWGFFSFAHTVHIYHRKQCFRFHIYYIYISTRNPDNCLQHSLHNCIFQLEIIQ